LDRSECERLGIEGAELTPALASGVNFSKAGVLVTVPDSRIEAAAFVELQRQQYGGGVVLLVANTASEPLSFTLTLSLNQISVTDGVAAVLFENRAVEFLDDKLTDSVDAKGTRAYRLATKNVSSHGVDDRVTKIAHPNPANLLLNPSFEESANWDFPDGFSVLVGKDREAAIFLDSRDSVHGMHSLRLHTPTDGGALQVVAYPIEAATLVPPFGKNYTLSLWARGVSPNGSAGPTLRFGVPYYDIYPWDPAVNCSLGPASLCHEFSATVQLTALWQRFSLPVSTPNHAMNGEFLESLNFVLGGTQIIRSDALGR
jgi:hypothetical protein